MLGFLEHVLGRHQRRPDVGAALGHLVGVDGAQKKFGRRVQKIPRRHRLARADIECPGARRRRLERQKNRTADVADVNRVILLVSPSGNHPLGTLTRPFDELPVEG